MKQKCIIVFPCKTLFLYLAASTIEVFVLRYNDHISCLFPDCGIFVNMSLWRVYQKEITHPKNFQKFDLYLNYCNFNFTMKSIGRTRLIKIPLKKHTVSFEKFHLVMFYGNQIIWTVKIRTSQSTRSKGKQQARNNSTLSAGFQWTVHNTHWYHAASSIKST
jgi:hypothetical protein